MLEIVISTFAKDKLTHLKNVSNILKSFHIFFRETKGF